MKTNRPKLDIEWETPFQFILKEGRQKTVYRVREPWDATTVRYWFVV